MQGDGAAATGVEIRGDGNYGTVPEIEYVSNGNVAINCATMSSATAATVAIRFWPVSSITPADSATVPTLTQNCAVGSSIGCTNPTLRVNMDVTMLPEIETQFASAGALFAFPARGTQSTLVRNIGTSAVGVTPTTVLANPTLMQQMCAACGAAAI